MIPEQGSSLGERAARGRDPGGTLVRAAEKALASLGLARDEPARLKIAVQQTLQAPGAARVTVALRGDVSGLLLFSFPWPQAFGVAGAVAQQSFGPGEEELVLDALAELANLIAGYAATEFEREGLEVEIGPPAAGGGGEIRHASSGAAEALRVSLEPAAGGFELALFLNGQRT
ncbi:MAG: chemotaxis protein CheX [Deltaproteobacteria bacterium]|nr:chemotaxis protein CheX [Deltaproteobacteria bacterium]